MLIEFLFLARELKFNFDGASKHGVASMFFIVVGDLSIWDGEIRLEVNEALIKLSLLFKLLVLIVLVILAYSSINSYLAFYVSYAI